MSSDGLWADQNLRGGLASSRAAVEFARARLQENGNDLSVTTDALVQEAVKAAESDNTTAILVSFQDVEQVVALASNHCRDALPACPSFGPHFLLCRCRSTSPPLSHASATKCPSSSPNPSEPGRHAFMFVCSCLNQPNPEQVDVQVKVPVYKEIKIPSVRQKFINVPSKNATLSS